MQRTVWPIFDIDCGQSPLLDCGRGATALTFCLTDKSRKKTATPETQSGSVAAAVQSHFVTQSAGRRRHAFHCLRLPCLNAAFSAGREERTADLME